MISLVKDIVLELNTININVIILCATKWRQTTGESPGIEGSSSHYEASFGLRR